MISTENVLKIHENFIEQINSTNHYSPKKLNRFNLSNQSTPQNLEVGQ